MNDKDFKSKYSSRGTISKKCDVCGKEFKVIWKGKSQYYFADACDTCPTCWNGK